MNVKQSNNLRFSALAAAPQAFNNLYASQRRLLYTLNIAERHY